MLSEKEMTLVSGGDKSGNFYVVGTQPGGINVVIVGFTSRQDANAAAKTGRQDGWDKVSVVSS
jgi:hypothetical protein